jgi:clan AA aspartic protease (TIGR02281 family)
MSGALVVLVCALIGVGGRPRMHHDVPLAGNGRHLIVDARLNSTVSGPMLVDTGASYCVVTREIARRLNLRPIRHASVSVATANGAVAADLVELDSVALHGARLARVQAVVMDAVEPPLIGIVGLSYLTQFRFSVDHGAGLLRLER